MSRRGALASLASLPLIGCGGVSLSGEDAASDSLNTAAQKSGRRWGSAIRWSNDTSGGAIQNPQYTAVVNAECGIVVPENEMKWQFTRPEVDVYDFERMDAIATWAMANGQALRGHTLLWHRPQWFPDWLNNYDYGANPVQEAERILVDHIRTVTDRYRGQITSYDVVNEAIDHDTDGTLETSMSRAMGSPEAVLDLAFHTAREQLPDGELVYNDYMSWEPDHADHCNAVLRLLEGFRNRGVPVDTLGIQSHIEIYSIDPASGVGPYREAEWRAFLNEAVGMGYKLMITEFDVKDKALTSDIAERDAKIADYTRRYFDVMLEYGELTDILAWGMVDQFNWLQGFAPRDDGMEVRGTPYSSEYQRKPMRDAIATALEEAAA
ncbi:glycosyl hydrolase [Alteraurantiacibacter aquimixticola]|uniref:Beta-xylanase n=2 Tax=Alteraurantiacibacter aquimixticola TaxID=2489173 RepID=A0A4T3F8H3_9SPHN|nr:glycosyl hydrolase [Alteraurantiacibacter aquimixticola]